MKNQNDFENKSTFFSGGNDSVNTDLKSVVNLQEESNFSYYIMLLCIGFLIIGLGIFDMKLIKKHVGKYNPNDLLVYRSLVVSTLSAFNMKWNKKRILFISEMVSPYLLIIRCLMNFLSSIMFLLCLDYLRLSTSVIFTSFAPVFTCIFTVIILKEKFYFRYLTGILICLGGSLILVMNEKSPTNNNNEVINNTDELSNNHNLSYPKTSKLDENFPIYTIIGCCFGFTHSLSLGFQYTLNKVLLNQKIESNLLLFYLGLFVGGSALLIRIFQGDFGQLTNKAFFIHAVFNGVIYYIGLYINNIAYSHVELLKTTGIAYIQVIESFCLGFIFLAEPIFFSDILGTLMIISYNIYNATYPLS